MAAHFEDTLGDSCQTDRGASRTDLSYIKIIDIWQINYTLTNVSGSKHTNCVIVGLFEWQTGLEVASDTHIVSTNIAGER